MKNDNQVIFTTRKATNTDFDSIYSLKKSSVRPYVEKIWGWDEEYQYKDFSADFTQIDQFDVIELGNSFIGYLQTFIHDNTLELIEIHLLPQFRGQGIGSILINNIIKIAKETNKKVSLGCFKENKKAKALYERLGFTLMAETETHYLLEY